MNIVFMGDSITDTHRQRDTELRPDALGMGYPLLIASSMGFRYPDKDLRFLNRGISADKVTNLLTRWKKDAIATSPDILVLMIGVNDVWHEFADGNGTDLDIFEDCYRMLLDMSYEANEDLKVILVEPYCLDGFGVVGPEWQKKLHLERRAIRRLAEEFMVDAVVPMQDIFDEALKKAGPEHWTRDGVHPQPAGHMLIADSVMKELEKLIDLD